jgi:hypothetical protein
MAIDAYLRSRGEPPSGGISTARTWLRLQDLIRSGKKVCDQH